MRNAIRNAATGLFASTIALSLVACGQTSGQVTTGTGDAGSVATATAGDTDKAVSTVANMTGDGVIDTTDLFTERDLSQKADLSEAMTVTLRDGEDVSITEAGTYVLTGTATGVTVTVDVPDDAKVQIVLDGASITNPDSPAIYVRNADKTFVTTTQGSDNALQVTGVFTADGTTNTDGVIFAKDDLTLNGLGKLTVRSTDNGIVCKDDLKVTGGTYEIEADGHGIQSKDSVAISDGTIAITAGKDGIHAKDSDDDTKGSVYVCGGTIDIDADSDGIQATTYLQVDGGTISIDAGEGFEATYVQVNGGDVSITATDDGINATTKSVSVGTPTIEVRGGNLSIDMGQGDTDAIDVSGNLTVSGGTIDITAQFAFDFDGEASFTDGTITVNGEQVTEITNSMMMGGGGPMGGGMGRGNMQGGMPGGGMSGDGNAPSDMAPGNQG